MQTMDALLTQLDDLKVALLEGIVYKTPEVSFKVAGEVYEMPSVEARSLAGTLGSALGILYELASSAGDLPEPYLLTSISDSATVVVVRPQGPGRRKD